MQDHEHLRLVVETAPIAIIVADGEGRIGMLNGQGARLFGYGADELLGRPIEALVPERFRGRHAGQPGGALAASLVRAIGLGRDLYGLCKDGSEVAIEVGLHPVTTPQGSFTLAAITNITERKYAEQMRLQRDRAVDASRLKSQFVSTMSDELRMPLNAIIGMAELLTNSDLNERQRTYVKTIDTAAEALLAVITSILDFSKIQSGRIDLDSRDFELGALLTAMVSVVSGDVTQKGLTLSTSIDPLIPPILRGDEDRLRQVLLNLVGNAVKFTQSGSIMVRASPVKSTSRYVTLRFEIQDTGDGISHDVLPKVFSPFVQGDGSASRKYGGAGLGLSIAKRLVELMQGEVGVSSKPGAGSLFWFTARLGIGGGDDRMSEPNRASHAFKRIADALVSTPAAKTAGPAVLVAEDNAELQTVLEHQFAELAVPLTIVSDGVEALAAVRSKSFALVFMDCHMPNLDGFAATRAIRNDERSTGAHLPIVAVTANAFKEDRAACLAAGMDDYIAKPVRIKDFRTMIERWTSARN